VYNAAVHKQPYPHHFWAKNQENNSMIILSKKSGSKNIDISTKNNALKFRVLHTLKYTHKKRGSP
jgi:hypothetical protein